MIRIYNRQSKSYEEELVVAKKYIKWCYESPVGKTFTELFFKEMDKDFDKNNQTAKTEPKK